MPDWASTGDIIRKNMNHNKNNYTRNIIIVVSCLLFMGIGFILVTSCQKRTTINNRTITNDKIRALYDIIDSLKTENGFLQVELEAYKHSPAKVLANIRQSYEEKKYLDIKDSLEFLQKYHPETPECAAAKKIYKQAMREMEIEMKKTAELRQKEKAKWEAQIAKDEAERKARAAKAEAERNAKITPVERIMKKYGCSRDIAVSFNNRHIRLGMTKDMVIDVMGRPSRNHRTTDFDGVHELWCYPGDVYLYFENGILTSCQD